MGCTRRVGEVWDDTKSCGRHVAVGLKKLTGCNQYSRQVNCKEEFMGWHEDPYTYGELADLDFVPLMDEKDGVEIAMVDRASMHARGAPGESGSMLPGIEAFRDPSTISGARDVFQNVHFDYNSNILKGDRNLDIISRVGDYLRNHPQTYIFVEGHCDERGPESYNIALGLRRSNAVRNLLMQQGADGNQIFTISYGKERPLNRSSTEEAWAMNRRVEFKIYSR
jgi:peptidoglycan-associated lipoprotein